MHFSDDAQAFFYRWWANHEKSLENADGHQGLLDHLAQFRNLFPALALLLYLFDAAAEKDNFTLENRVNLTSAQRAFGFCRLLEGHARRIYGIALRPEIPRAKIILEKIYEGRLEERFAGRDVYNNGWGGMTKAADVEKPLKLLENYGYLRIEWIKPSVNGGPWAKCFVAN